jgi:hypothetical protein
MYDSTIWANPTAPDIAKLGTALFPGVPLSWRPIGIFHPRLAGGDWDRMGDVPETEIARRDRLATLAQRIEDETIRSIVTHRLGLADERSFWDNTTTANRVGLSEHDAAEAFATAIGDLVLYA